MGSSTVGQSSQSTDMAVWDQEQHRKNMDRLDAQSVKDKVDKKSRDNILGTI